MPWFLLTRTAAYRWLRPSRLKQVFWRSNANARAAAQRQEQLVDQAVEEPSRPAIRLAPNGLRNRVAVRLDRVLAFLDAKGWRLDHQSQFDCSPERRRPRIGSLCRRKGLCGDGDTRLGQGTPH